MKRVDEQGRVISFSIFGVSRYRKDQLLEADPVAILFADGHVRECAVFDTNSMTVEYEKGKWYGF